jgi:hypothetical protein
MLKGAADDGLAQLDAYLHGTSDSATPEPAPDVLSDPHSPWRTGGFRLFMSHVSAQKKNAKSLAKALEQFSIEVFVAHESIDVTDDWQTVIEAGLSTCDGLVAFLSPGFRESDWCDQEVGFAVERGVVIVPLGLGMNPYGFIGKIQCLKLYDGQKMSEVAREIYEAVLKHPQSRTLMAQALLSRFEESESFDAVRTNIGYLRRIPAEAWNDDLKQRALNPRDSHGQISQTYVGARMAPEVVAEIIDGLP